MERKEFNERIQKEYEDFKERTLELTKEEIFDKGFEIDFKTYMTEYLQNEDGIIEDKTINNLSKFEGLILEEMFNIYLNNDSYYTYEDMCEEILEIFDEENTDDGELE